MRAPSRNSLHAAWLGMSAGDWRALTILLLLALVVRLLALRAPPLPIDLHNWSAWAERVTAFGPGRFYRGNVLADIGPLYVLVLACLGFLARAGLGSASLLFRLPGVVADLAIGAAIFIAVLRVWRPQGARPGRWPLAASLAAAVWLFNPAAVLLSAVWGQIESVYALFLLLSVLLLDATPLGSLLCLVIALLIEPRSLELAPLVAIVLVARHGVRALLWPVASAVVLWAVLTIPFFGANVIGGPFGVLYASNNAYPDTALNALNIWAVGGSFRSDLAPIVLGLTPLAAGLLLYGFGIWYGVVVLQDQLQHGTDTLLLGSLIGTYLLFLPYAVLTRQHDRWLLPVLPLLLVFGFTCLRRSPAAARFVAMPLLLYAALSALLFLDLYRVYEEALYAPSAPPASMGFYSLIASSVPVWAVLSAWAFWAFAVILPWWLPPGLFLRSAPSPAHTGANGAEAVAYDG
jgi:dolichyl-phosphate-mannose-protein mannosyltransferase